MRCNVAELTEVCWNNNKANVFPVQKDAPLMGCQTNFLLSESWRQPNRRSNRDSSLLWALRGYIHILNYHPLCLIITYRHTKKSQIRCTVRKIVFHQLHAPTHVQSWSKPASEGHLWKHLTQLDGIFCFAPFPRCENCVEMLFVRGSGNCVQCDTPLRKSNFRVQLFEDPTVDKEVEIRKKVLKM